ncbi:glycosyltransferase family 4 protein [Aquimarina sp. U1-2]|uniref:glycosyltransferase family 4 protein n=1 Tax=Aquimarina sp. U1-2 TaxID=2823141 RepID=UPI001AECEDBF|nr:glycosyltransferase family 4 protein [Aquimarina sp. U1-2]MBP2832013.1 glycosyltransferase family 4 protein [Aquimarina sp. U1-2]
MKAKNKFFIITTVPMTLGFFRGQIQVLKKNYDVELISSPNEELTKISETEDVKVKGIEMKREISVFNDVKSLISLFLYFRKSKPFLVHGNTPKGGFLSMCAAYLARVPNRVYCVHGLRYEGSTGLKRKLLKTMEKLSCFFATDVLAVSFGLKETLKNEEITKKNVNVIGSGSINGIDLTHFSPELYTKKTLRKEQRLSDDAFVFGFVGRLVKDKGINELVESFVELHHQNNKLRLLLIGSYEEELDPLKKETVATINEHSSIIHAGFQKDIRPFLMMMDVFVFPSYREGFGVSIMEAGAMGIPVISSDISGCNEIIKNEENGILIRSRSKEELMQAMHLLYNDHTLCKTMASSSREKIRDRYEQKKVWNAIQEYYNKLL